jgi:2-polyprenyl-3-methyl-5-hydroxy-6-metoxy-1,4-benzoquinol methylase
MTEGIERRNGYLENSTGRLYFEPLNEGGLRLRAETGDQKFRIAGSPLITYYPIELVSLIFESYGAGYTCDEISRDTDETEAALDVRYSIVAYFDDEIFTRRLRILDYGCGAGSSTITLARLFPNADIVGFDINPAFLEIARRRAKHYGLDRVSYAKVEKTGFVEGVSDFDMAFLNAVYEHLLPSERSSVLASTWRALNAGGILIVNQTPYRWFPVETHTSGLPLINYLPDRLALLAVHKLSKRRLKIDTWEQLLRAGVRGATVGEITGHLKRLEGGVQLLSPCRLSMTWAGIWYAAKRARLGKVGRPATRRAIVLMEMLVRLTRLPFSPYLNIAMRKPADSGTQQKHPLRPL